MHSTTLRGVFPDSKPVYRRNFIKENVKSIKQMQGILQEAGVIQPRKRSEKTLDKFKNAARLARSTESNLSKSNPVLAKSENTNLDEKPEIKHVATGVPRIVKNKTVLKKKENINFCTVEESKITHRAMQTERQENLEHLYDTGVIKYPSPNILKSGSVLHSGEGDNINITDNMEHLTLESKDFIKENMQNIKTRPVRHSPVKVMASAPSNYQKGVVPKYLRDKKEEVLEENEPECPPGHILLPEDERKETLRVLRQSYADRIQELNMMPVRNDTLKMKKRKMEIEEELKRIDGGIKVFQRPKVFVKINA
ncbi:uncharacterized protein LOC115879308 isoform X1 [Sitophilus oryzae]|uniref:Uncharacterized protein LOC115879308 isoform X1 n=2 Tax=Sitophilus oryzae TaxID=7048 RepID=A0A6J2XMN1_SITOR|nr:uncharacterized protein LOC115879308 isoform X1 [Sitophilus oryzae]